MERLKNSKIGKLAQRIAAMQIPIYASHACYFLVLAVFPTLVLILGMLRYTSLQVTDLMDLTEGFFPAALQPYAWKLISSTYENTSKLVVSVSAFTALWSAGRGIYGIVKGLNAIYGVSEGRSWLRTRCMCVVYMILFLLMLMLTLVFHVFGNTIVAYLRTTVSESFWFWIDLIDLRFFLLVILQTLLFCAIFMYLPDRDNGFRESLPGAMLASVGWMSVSTLFSLYVQYFPLYSNIFGSVYIVALALLWLYLCVNMVFYGAVLNVLLKEMQ